MAPRPVTILIDSEELESGEPLSDSFRKLAAPEIDAFKRDLRARGRHTEADKITESDLLREVMNTVGQPGRLGEQIRCVVSVSMLTEGWDARTVTHVLGVRAFGTQLLCEQVIGRALRRVSYDPIEPDKTMFEPDTLMCSASPSRSFPPTRRPTTSRRSPHPRGSRAAGARGAGIRFPRVLGYRVVLPPGRLTAKFTPESRLSVTPEMAPPDAINAPFVGENIKLSLEELAGQRDAAIAFHLAGYTLERWFRDSEGDRKPWLFPCLLAITRRWMTECLSCDGGTFRAYLLWRDVGDKAAERILPRLHSEPERRRRAAADHGPLQRTRQQPLRRLQHDKSEFLDDRSGALPDQPCCLRRGLGGRLRPGAGSDAGGAALREERPARLRGALRAWRTGPSVSSGFYRGAGRRRRAGRSVAFSS